MGIQKGEISYDHTKISDPKIIITVKVIRWLYHHCGYFNVKCFSTKISDIIITLNKGDVFLWDV